MRPVVYEEAETTEYKANSAGAVVLDAVSMLIVLIVPFIICFAMGNFWTQYNVIEVTPTVGFTQRCVARVLYASGAEGFWACSSAVNDALVDDPIAMYPFFSYAVGDRDANGLADSFTFSLQVPLETVTVASNAVDSVVRVDFLPEFWFNVSTYLFHLSMTTAPLVSVTIPNDGSNVALVHGDLNFAQTEIVVSSLYVNYTHAYTGSLFTQASLNDLINVGSLAGAYARRNQSLDFKPRSIAIGDQSLLQSQDVAAAHFTDFNDARSFQLELRMGVSQAFIQYRPNPGEVLKWGWVQFFCVAYVVHWFMRLLRGFMVKQGMVNTVAVPSNRGRRL